MNESKLTYTTFVLPLSIVNKVEVSRLVQEVERVDNELTAVAVRTKAGASQINTPVISEQFAEFLQLNKLTFDGDGLKRTELIKQLRILKDKVPVIHMTFAVAADRESLQQLAQWLRSSVHPQAVIAVGLQPALVAGVYLRTPNRVHDMSLRAALNGRHDLLVKELGALRGRI